MQINLRLHGAKSASADCAAEWLGVFAANSFAYPNFMTITPSSTLLPDALASTHPARRSQSDLRHRINSAASQTRNWLKPIVMIMRYLLNSPASMIRCNPLIIEDIPRLLVQPISISIDNHQVADVPDAANDLCDVDADW